MRYLQLYDIEAGEVVSDLMQANGAAFSGFPVHATDDAVYYAEPGDIGCAKGIYAWRGGDPVEMILPEHTMYFRKGPQGNGAFMVLGIDGQPSSYYYQPRDGEPVLMGSHPGRSGPTPFHIFGVHGRRVIYGIDDTERHKQVVYLWDDGELQELLPALQSRCIGINDRHALWSFGGDEVYAYDGATTHTLSLGDNLLTCNYGGGRWITWATFHGVHVAQLPL